MYPVMLSRKTQEEEADLTRLQHPRSGGEGNNLFQSTTETRQIQKANKITRVHRRPRYFLRQLLNCPRKAPYFGQSRHSQIIRKLLKITTSHKRTG